MKMVARFIPVVIMVLLVAALSASPVLANPGHGGGHGKGGENGGGKGKGNSGNNTTSSGTLTIQEGPNPYPYGSQITFDVDGGKDGMWVRNECSQSGSLVYAQYVKVEGGEAGPFTLGPTPSWSGGNADCHAFLLTSTLNVVKGSDMFYQVEG